MSTTVVGRGIGRSWVWLLPMLIHRDEAMAECLAAKQPVGEFRSDALAAEEILTLANWCLLNYSGLKTPVGSAS